MVEAEPSLAFYGDNPRIAVLQAGKGEAIVFLHGLGSTKENWDAQLRSFGGYYFVVAWDARGYGDSDDGSSHLVFARDFTDDLKALLDSLRVERAHLVGLSMGGLIAQCFYFAYRARVATLTLADTFPYFGGLGAETVARFTAFRLQPLIDGATPADLAQSAIPSLMAPHADDAAKAKLLASLAGLRKEPYIKTIRALLDQEAPGDLKMVAVPTLVIVGEHDLLSPPSIAEALAAQIPGSRLVVLEGAGHMSSMERPAEFNETLRSFLAAHKGVASEHVEA